MAKSKAGRSRRTGKAGSSHKAGAQAARRSSPARSGRSAKPARKASTPRARSTPRRTPAQAGAAARPIGLFGPVAGAERRDVGTVQLEVGRAGAARVKRLIYPAGFRWSTNMKPAVGGDYCMHAHVGFLAHGEIHIEYPDGCIIEHKAPHVICIEPGHDGWVVGDEPVVMIEIDFEGDTVKRLGMPTAHRH